MFELVSVGLNYAPLGVLFFLCFDLILFISQSNKWDGEGGYNFLMLW